MDVVKIAERLGIQIVESGFDPGVSGLIVRKDGKVFLGVNETDAAVRKRFTIAHELGHFTLHMGKTLPLGKPIFVDNVAARDQSSSRGLIPEEIEANKFAAELLMPHSFISRDVSKADPRKLVEDLADKYDVSQTAMTLRLTNLGYHLST